MTDYKAMIEEHSCKPNQGCGVMTICMCGVAEDMADEIERLREALRDINMLNNANYHSDSPRLHIGGIRMIIRAALGENE